MRITFLGSLLPGIAIDVCRFSRRALHRSPQDWSSYNGYLSDAGEHSAETLPFLHELIPPRASIIVKQCHIMKGQQTLGQSCHETSDLRLLERLM